MRTLIALLLLSGTLLAQNSPATIHFDRGFHAAGEVSRFAAYLPRPAPPTVRVAIYGPDGGVEDYFFLKTDANGVAHGYYRWPFEAPTAYYRVVVSALATDDRIVDLVSLAHPVYGEGSRRQTPVPAARTPPPVTDFATTVTDGRLSAAGLPEGAYSLRVYNLEVTGEFAPPPAPPVPAAAAPGYRDTLFYPGVLSAAPTGEPLAVNLLPFFDVSTLRTYFSKSVADGRFLLTLAPFEGGKRVQARSITDAGIRARLDFPALPALTAAPPVTERVLRYLDLSNRRRKIYQLYQTVETEVVATATPEAVVPPAPSKDFDVQDYKAFPDMFTFFKEVAGELRYRKRKDGYYSRLYNAPNQRFFSEEPLFIVDGKLTRDPNYIAKIKPADVRRLSFYFDHQALRRQFPALGNHGVVRLEMLRNDPNFPAEDLANVLDVNGFQPEATFGQREATDVPNLSPLLLWTTGRTDGELSLSLPATDDHGTYRAELLLRTDDGRLLRSSTIFSIGSSR